MNFTISKNKKLCLCLRVLRSALYIILIVIVFDLLINLVIPNKIKKTIGIVGNYSLKSDKFHHVIAPNINLTDRWGGEKYKVITNKYSMRISQGYEIDSSKENIAFIGDSFVWGSGIGYKDHFIHLIQKKIKNYNLLNLGYVSYSPSIYFKRIKYLIEEDNLRFSRIFIFIDHSDIQDEGIFYREDINGNIVRKWTSDEENKKRNQKYIVKNYLKQNSFIYKLYDIFNLPNISKKSGECLKKKNINFLDYLEYERFSYGFDKNIKQKKWVNEGLKKTDIYLNKIKRLSEKYKFDITLVYYPSAIEVIKNIKLDNNMHLEYLRNWSLNNKKDFIDTSIDFQKYEDGKDNYLNFFIKCDAHWNIKGHSIIAKNIVKYSKNIEF